MPVRRASAFFAESEAIWYWAGNGPHVGREAGVHQPGLVLFLRSLVEPSAHVRERIDEHWD